jgi:hypothetical protein
VAYGFVKVPRGDLRQDCEIHVHFHGSTEVSYWMQLSDGTRIDFPCDGTRAMMNGDTLILRGLRTEIIAHD